MSDWQPIETAPKDGTRVLACNKGNPNSIKIVYWQKMQRVPDRWASRGLGPCPRAPTHWQPLPEPPEVSDE